MAEDLNNTFGFELLNKLYDTQIAKKEDILILFVHWYCIKNGFRCIGLGDSVSFHHSSMLLYVFYIKPANINISVIVFYILQKS